jgi:hypothetical protein
MRAVDRRGALQVLVYLAVHGSSAVSSCLSSLQTRTNAPVDFTQDGGGVKARLEDASGNIQECAAS